MKNIIMKSATWYINFKILFKLKLIYFKFWCNMLCKGNKQNIIHLLRLKMYPIKFLWKLSIFVLIWKSSEHVGSGLLFLLLWAL